MTDIKIYNSLTRRVESFEPAESGKVRMFVCGPTVYDHIHMGNARTFTVFDVVARWLRHSGLTVEYIQNITDIDNKIIDRAAQEGMGATEFARKYEHDYRNDMQILGNHSVDRYARATDHIPQVISQIKALIDKGHVYLIESDGWYFDLTTFADYGKLSGRTGAAADDGVSRIDDSDHKRNTGDFCVWKLKKADEPSWPDEHLGEGRPGWHIEDTAITEHYFGPQYDLHGGGMDLKFPHHEAEIAQQESASGKVPFVRYWMHVGFLENQQRKMSKSLGNFMTLRQALEQYEPEVLRFYFLSNHYRAPLDFSETALNAAAAAVERIGELSRKPWPRTARVDEAIAAITEAMNDDFNTPKAFGAMFEFIRECNRSQILPPQSFFDFLSDTFGIVPFGDSSIPTDIQELVDRRQAARETKDFAASDSIRDELIAKGYTIDDTPYGPIVKKK